MSKRGPDGTRFTREAYMMVIRMMAENYKRIQIMRVIHDRFPQHRPGEELEVSYQMLYQLSRSRREEVMELREELNRELTDMWMANKRQRIQALQDIYEDCNRWVPRRIIEAPKKSGVPGVPVEDAKPVLVYEKNVRGMLDALKQAREEMGDTPEGKIAQSFADLVRQAEEQRGLEKTADVTVHPVDAVDYIEDAVVLEIEGPSRSKGADTKRGFLDGADPSLSGNATKLLEDGT